MELKKLCRICLIKCENQIMYSIFSEGTILKLSVCAGLNLNNDKNINLPDQMCEQCYQNLENAHQFRITCQSSEKRLNDLTKNIIGTENLKDFIVIQSELSRHTENKIQKCKVYEEKINFKTEIPSKLKPQPNQLSDIESDTNIVKAEITQNDIKIKRKYTRKKCKEKQKKVDNEKLTCEICQVGYKAKNAFIYHMRRHRNEMDFICEICGSAFETNFKLSRHLLQHTGTKKYPCRTCDISFPTSSNRDRHERRLHTTIRPFQCEYCVKVFAYSDQLKNHIRVHTGEKPFVCEKCGTGFRRKSHLITHKKSITPCYLKNKERNDAN